MNLPSFKLGVILPTKISMASLKLHRRLEGKVAIITGAAGGIGECFARLFAKHGAKIVAADINHELGEKLCQELGGSKHASFVHCDEGIRHRNDSKHCRLHI